MKLICYHILFYVFYDTLAKAILNLNRGTRLQSVVYKDTSLTETKCT